MNESQITKEKTCAFYASDYHFEIISLPYIEEQLEKNKQIIVLTENDLEESVKTVISKTNLKETKRKNIFSIDWNNDNLSKFKKIKKDIEDQKDIIIFIKGKENYIKNVNRNIEKFVSNKDNVKIVDCYDIEEVSQDIDSIMNKYEKVLSTTGEKEINKINYSIYR